MADRAARGGITTVGALGVLFVGLKLSHVIDWPWWLVTLPFWAWLAVILATLAVLGLIAGACRVAFWIACLLDRDHR